MNLVNLFKTGRGCGFSPYPLFLSFYKKNEIGIFAYKIL